MVAFLATMEILVVSAVPHVYALVDVPGSVGVNQVDNHLDIETVSRVNESFEVVGGTKT